MANFWKIVNKVIEEANIVLLVIDSKMPKETTNQEIIEKAKEKNKPVITVLTKCDSINQKEAKEKSQKIENSVFVSAKKYYGITKLTNKIKYVMKKNKITDAKIGIFGYPNVGKSTLINALKGKESTKTSKHSGQTKGMQKIRISTDMILIDTPGVIPYKKIDEAKQAINRTTNANQIKDPESAFYKLFEKEKEKIIKFYKLEEDINEEEAIEKIAKKKGYLQSKGKMDTNRTTRAVINDWQEKNF